MIQENDILYTKDLVELLGTDKQKNSYYKNCKLRSSVKKALLRKLRTIAEFEEEKEGRKKYFKIKKVLNREESLRKKLSTFSKFTIAVDESVLMCLNNMKIEKETLITNKKIIKETGLTNDFFWRLHESEVTLEEANKKGLDLQIARYYTGLMKNQLGIIIRDSLKRLEKNKLLKTREVMIVATTEGEHREATKRERKKLLEIQDSVLERLKCSTVRGAVFIGAFLIYSKMMRGAIREAGLDIEYFYRGYHLTEVNFSHFMSVKEKEIIDEHLNKHLKKMIYDRCLSRRVRLMENNKSFFGDELIVKLELEENFLSQIELLIDLTLGR